MGPGCLVTVSNRWTLNSKKLGVVICEASEAQDAWLVLWAIKDSYELQEHKESALIDLNEVDVEQVRLRGCTSR